ncbi:phenylacetate--CoA ligase family protein [Streptomyces sp. NPDC091280]|uniref:phenylacetate--CoA ligase family protein n=1 Tax=Streptomyces sp. NPDC091280 TaxID=3365984 RepID=UPI00382548F6
MPPATAALPSETLRDVLARVVEIPELRATYEKFLDLDAVTLADLPVLTKETLAGALNGVIRQARSRPHGAYVYGSGGTTGTPRLSLVPTGMFVEDITRHWQPLASDDILVNFNTPGRMWSSHNFFNAVAHHAGAVTIPLGAVDNDELADWLDFVDQLGATALDATPSQIARILEFCDSTGRPLPAFRKLLWTGEGYSKRAAEITRRLMPDGRLYGVYGSTESWVIGVNEPDCPTDTFHVVPYQHVEIEDGVVLVTNTHPESVNPILRYRIGDLGEFVDCPCGRPDRALRIRGRDDPQLKFSSILLLPTDVTEVARAVSGVRDVQLVLFRHGQPDERMEIRLLVQPDTPREDIERLVHQRVVTQVYKLGFAVGSAPDRLAVRVVDELVTSAQTQKTPLVVHAEKAGVAPSAPVGGQD